MLAERIILLAAVIRLTKVSGIFSQIEIREEMPAATGVLQKKNLTSHLHVGSLH